MSSIDPIFTTLKQFEEQRQRYEQQIGQQFGLNRADVRLLSFLTDAQPTITDLHHLTGLDISTLSRQLTALTHKKLLQKHSDQHDRRKRTFILTELGRTQFQHFRQATADLEQAILANWPADEQQLLKVLLKRLVSSTQRLAPTMVGK